MSQQPDQPVTVQLDAEGRGTAHLPVLDEQPPIPAPVAYPQIEDLDDDWLAGSTACPVDAGPECEACQ